MRGALVTCLEQSTVDYTAAETIAYQANYPSVLYRAAEYFYQLAVTYSVKEALKAEVDYILVAAVHYLLRSSQCLMTPPLGTEAVACPGKLAIIEEGGNHLVDGLLNQLVNHGRDFR